MTKELENRILLLYAILNLGGNSNKKGVLDFIIENDLIALEDMDKELLVSRKEIRWRNELAYVRQHLVEIDALNKYEWSITPIGKMYYNSLVHDLTNIDTEYKLRRLKKPNIFVPISDFRVEVIEDIYKGVELSSTNIEAIVLCRRGQGIFRLNLLKLWKKCCVTGDSNGELLIASHIKPWRFSNNFERLDKFNGLLLTPTLDRLFDKGLITFDCNNGKILLSKELKDIELLGINSDMRINLFEENKKYLEYHNKHVFKDKIEMRL